MLLASVVYIFIWVIYDYVFGFNTSSLTGMHSADIPAGISTAVRK